MLTKKFDSSRGEKGKYTAVIADDGRCGCNCKGWTIFKNRARFCTHLKEWTADLHARLEERGEYTYAFTGVAFTKQAASAPEPPDVSEDYPGQHITGPDIDPSDGFVAPMLASPMGSAQIADWREWAIEEKYDGHRVVVAVRVGGAVRAWSRPGAGKKIGIARELPQHIVDDFSENFPTGTYDGELMVPGSRHYGVRDLRNAGKEVFVVYDLLRRGDVDVTRSTYDARRARLADDVFGDRPTDMPVVLAPSVNLASEADVVRFVEAVWAAGGEGAILKRRAAPYQPGKRGPDFVKVKKVQTTVMEVVGFVAGKLGPYSTVALRGADGRETTVKTKNMAELRMFEREAASAYARRAGTHNSIGRKLRIEFVDFNPDGGGFVNPRWDRWEDR